MLSFLLACLAAQACEAQFVVDSLDGEVTQHEADAFISAVAATPIPNSEWTPTITHNQLADGKGGMTLEGINLMYQVTGDIPSLSSEHMQLLNLAIQWNDAWLSHRNDQPMGEHRVMWTGNIEAVWPPNCPTCDSSTYYESEVGDTIGHMAYTAYNILNTPSIWNNTVPDGDPDGYGATYLARAKTYISMLEFSMSTSFTPYFTDSSTLLIKRPSTAQGYQSTFHNVNAWNVQMMLLNAYWRLAQCHFILGDNPSLAVMYKTIVQKSADMFVQNAVPITAPDGTPVYDWGYCNFGDCTGRLTGEQNGVHGSYDMWGLTRAYASGYSTVPSAQQMKTYADTVVHEMTLSIDSAGAATYASFNDRCCDTSTYNYLPYGYMFLTPYNTAIYRPAANADINSGRQKGDAGLTAEVLWAKHLVNTSTTTSISSSVNPSVFGQPVALTAQVSPTSATGTMQFKDGTSNLGAPIALTNGSATLTISSLTVGGHSISATYSGDTTFISSTSSPLAQTISQDASATGVASSANPSAYNQPVTLTATVSAAAPGAGAPSGTIQFKDGANNLGLALTLSSGAAAYTTTALSVGSHSITAVYNGDGNFTGGTSSSLMQTIYQAPTTVALNTDNNPSGSGQLVTFTATVSPVAATGAVQFMDNGSSLGAAVTLNAGTASYSTTTLTSGTHNITANYGGDGNFLSGVSPALTQVVTVTGSVTTSTTLDAPPVVSFHQKTAGIFSVQVTASDGTTPSGTVVLCEENKILATMPDLDGNGKSSLPFRQLRIGENKIRAIYLGDSGSNMNTSASTSETTYGSPRPYPR
jgi:hypothetical protein